MCEKVDLEEGERKPESEKTKESKNIELINPLPLWEERPEATRCGRLEKSAELEKKDPRFKDCPLHRTDLLDNRTERRSLHALLFCRSNIRVRNSFPRYVPPVLSGKPIPQNW